MKQIITHVTHYRYTAPVTYSIQTLRLTPRDASTSACCAGISRRPARWSGKWTPTAISPIP